MECLDLQPLLVISPYFFAFVSSIDDLCFYAFVYKMLCGL